MLSKDASGPDSLWLHFSTDNTKRDRRKRGEEYGLEYALSQIRASDAIFVVEPSHGGTHP